MSWMIVDMAREILFPDRDRHAIPSLDGPWHSNQALDEADLLRTLPAPDDLAQMPAGVVVSSETRIIRVEDGSVVHEATGLIGGLASDASGNLAACVEGQGVQIVAGPRSGAMLSDTDGAPLKFATAATFAPDGSLWVTEGSASYGPSAWVHDLVTKGKSGRLLRFDMLTGRASTVARDLAYPAGVCVAEDGRSVCVTEAWSHTVTRYRVEGGAGTRVIRNMPGYPARLRPASGGGFWLSLVALRTQLVDFILGEEEYRLAMINEVDPKYWVAPTLATEDHFLEPCQGGSIKQLGIKKPWSPPRSYGLVIRLDASMDAQRSYHSRVGGHCHGTTGVLDVHGAVYVTSKGHGKVVRPLGEGPR